MFFCGWWMVRTCVKVDKLLCLGNLGAWYQGTPTHKKCLYFWDMLFFQLCRLCRLHKLPWLHHVKGMHYQRWIPAERCIGSPLETQRLQKTCPLEIIIAVYDFSEAASEIRGLYNPTIQYRYIYNILFVYDVLITVRVMIPNIFL